MSLENFTKSLVEELEGSVAVGAEVGDRIYPHGPPKNPTFPYIVFEVTIEETFESLGNHGSIATSSTTGLLRLSASFQCIAKTYGEARDAANAVKVLLHNVRDTSFGTTTPANVRIIRLESHESGYAPPIEGSNVRVFWEELVFNVWIIEN